MTEQAAHTRTLRLREPANQVSRQAKAMWRLEAGIGWGVLLVLEALGTGFGWFDLPRTVWVLVLAITAAITVIYLIVMPKIRYRVHRWETTPEAVYTRSGWLGIEWRIAPISRIQTVDTKRGLIERAFGLSSVTVTTASSAGPVLIRGLDLEVAANLSDELTARTAASEGDAT